VILKINGLNRQKNLIGNAAESATDCIRGLCIPQIDKIRSDPWKPSTPTL
jgi:hypothetical protein